MLYYAGGLNVRTAPKDAALVLSSFFDAWKEDDMKKSIMGKQYEKIYRQYADDVYKISVYYLHDEEQAKEVVEKAFKSLYKHINEVHPDYILGYLLGEVKGMTKNKPAENPVSEEVRQ